MRRQTSADSRRAAASSREAASAAPAWHSIPTAAARRFGLTSLQFGAMVHLNRINGTPGIEQNVLAARLNIDRNTASVTVEQMVKLGVMAREVNGADRRARLLRLTTKGDRIYAELLPAFTAVNANILNPISLREQKLFISLLIRIVEGNLREQRNR
jgi:DNA-binding MarR family transcriptional regulator